MTPCCSAAVSSFLSLFLPLLCCLFFSVFNFYQFVPASFLSIFFFNLVGVFFSCLFIQTLVCTQVYTNPPSLPVTYLIFLLCRIFVVGIGFFSLCFLMTSLGGQFSTKRLGDSPFTIHTEGIYMSHVYAEQYVSVTVVQLCVSAWVVLHSSFLSVTKSLENVAHGFPGASALCSTSLSLKYLIQVNLLRNHQESRQIQLMSSQNEWIDLKESYTNMKDEK